jgi:hypothetical protein
MHQTLTPIAGDFRLLPSFPSIAGRARCLPLLAARHAKIVAAGIADDGMSANYRRLLARTRTASTARSMGRTLL